MVSPAASTSPAPPAPFNWVKSVNGRSELPSLAPLAPAYDQSTYQMVELGTKLMVKVAVSVPFWAPGLPSETV